MKADHAAQLLLLDVQAADTALAQLAHKRAHLPQVARLGELARQDEILRNEVVDAQTRLGDVDEDQKRLQNEIDTVLAREARDEQRLQGGGLPAKELESLQHELQTLARRQSSLEDDLLEVMQHREDTERRLEQLRVKHAEVADEILHLEGERDAALAVIDASCSDTETERLRIAGDVPADLLALYEKAREHGGGVGAAMLRARRCEGCRIELSGSELNAVRAAGEDDVVRCDNCRRILVRTSESGL